MTTKEIAEAAGVSTDTVSRKIKELFPTKTQERKKTELNQKEAIEVMKSIRKLNFVELPQNATELPQNEQVNNIDAAFKLAIVTLTGMAQNLDSRMTKLENRIEQRQALLPAPAIKPRDHINMIMRKYVSDTGVDHRSAYGDLYREFKYRTKSDPVQCAKNRGMSAIEYIEIEGQIEILEAIAIEVFSRR